MRQIVLQKGILFEMKLSAYEKSAAYGFLAKEQFNIEIEKGLEDIKAGRVYSADEVEAEMKQYYNVKEYRKGCIILESREGDISTGSSSKTLADIDHVVSNFKRGNVSSTIDLSDF